MEYKQISARLKKKLVDKLDEFCIKTNTKKVDFLEKAIFNQLNKNDMDKKEFQAILKRVEETQKKEIIPAAAETETEKKEVVSTAAETEQKNEVSKEEVEREFLQLAERLRANKNENIVLEAKLEAANGEIKERIRKEIHLSPQANEIINILSKRSGKTTGEIISKYIEDYNLAKFTSWFHPWILTSEEEAFFINQIEADETRQTRIGEVVFND